MKHKENNKKLHYVSPFLSSDSPWCVKLIHYLNVSGFLILNSLLIKYILKNFCGPGIIFCIARVTSGWCPCNFRLQKWFRNVLFVSLWQRNIDQIIHQYSLSFYIIGIPFFVVSCVTKKYIVIVIYSKFTLIKE